MSKPKPLYQEVAKFVEFHLGRGSFAPHTGQDWAAWRAFVYLVECYALSGEKALITAMRDVAGCAQAKVLRTFAQAIPAVMDWGDVARLWPAIVGDRVDAVGQEMRYYAAIECTTRQGKKFLTMHGLKDPSEKRVAS